MLNLNKYYTPQISFFDHALGAYIQDGRYDFRRTKTFVEALEEVSKKIHNLEFVMVYIAPKGWNKIIHLIVPNKDIPNGLKHREWHSSITNIRELHFNEMINFLTR